MSKPRARNLGLLFSGHPGRDNAITDVPGVKVGMTTLIEGDGPLVVGKGPIRTGVIAILPRGYEAPLTPVWAGMFRFNGNGEMTGVHWIEDGGYFAGPICLTNTHSVGIAHHAAVAWMIEQYPESFLDAHLWAMPVIAETYDGVLNDINGQHVTPAHVLQALQNAETGPVREGNVGGGTGMIAYGYKGGTGTASRILTYHDQTFHVGVLVQANHGAREWLRIAGRPWTGAAPKPPIPGDQGSIIGIIATDIPMMPHQLKRVARRAALGIGRNGTIGGNSSGDLFLAFSTASPPPLPTSPEHLMTLQVATDQSFDPIYETVVDSMEEAVLNAMVAAESMTAIKPFGHPVEAISHAQLRAWVKDSPPSVRPT